jgi:SAM-dependent methyltransferase
MSSFALGRSFDAVICLFASIGYLDTEADARAAIACMSRHVSPGGVLLLEPPLGPERLRPSQRTTLRFTHHGAPVERVTDATHEPGRLCVRFDYSVGAERFSEEHPILTLPLAMFVDAMEQEGLEVDHDPTWPSGPGLLVGRQPAP